MPGRNDDIKFFSRILSRTRRFASQMLAVLDLIHTASPKRVRASTKRMASIVKSAIFSVFKVAQIGIGVLVIALTALGAVFIKFFADYEHSMRQIKAIGNLTESELRRLSKLVRAVAKEGKAGVADIQEVVKKLLKDGVALGNIEHILRPLVSLAAILDEDAESIGTQLGKALEVFGVKGSKSVEVLDKITYAAQRSKMTILDLTGIVAGGGGFTKQTNDGFDAFLAISSETSSALGSRFGSSYQNFWEQLFKGKTRRKLEEFGVATADVNGNLLTTLEIVENLDKRMNEVMGGSPKAQVVKLKDLFPEDGARRFFEVVRGGLNDIRATEKGILEDSVGYVRLLEKSTGASAKDYILSLWNLIKKIGADVGYLAQWLLSIAYFIISGLSRLTGFIAGIGSLLVSLFSGPSAIIVELKSWFDSLRSFFGYLDEEVEKDRTVKVKVDTVGEDENLLTPDELAEQTKSRTDATIDGMLKVAGGASKILRHLAEQQDKDTKEGFEKSKQYSLAAIWLEFAIGSVAAYTQAFRSFGDPVTAAIIGSANVAALLVTAGLATSIIASQEAPSKLHSGGRVGWLPEDRIAQQTYGLRSNEALRTLEYGEDVVPAGSRGKTMTIRNIIELDGTQIAQSVREHLINNGV